MQINYKVKITAPHQHMVQVRLETSKLSTENKLTFFLPSWSPGSYLMREYARHIRQMRVLNKTGEFLHFKQLSKNSWEIDWAKSEIESPTDEFIIEYEVYCHELTVRTSHITREHAYLHGPTYLLGFEQHEVVNPTVEINFPPLWSKISTGLKDISKKREHFIYQARDYDDLLDCPIEIGCQQTDGFMVGNIPHEIAFFGKTYPHRNNIKEHMQQIVEHISTKMGEIPYEKYLFLSHFAPNLYGGLEHANSTALQFDGTKLASRKDYINWLALVSHEYFHTWNVKRIRPKELGPFNYQTEAYTPLLWLAEGLTSLMDELFIYQCGLISLEEYLEMQKNNLNRYYATPGRRFDSLEDSSFNAWVKLYRPDENSANSSMSYYLKGGIAFWALNALLAKEGHHIQELIGALWQRYKDNPSEGMVSKEVFKLVEDIGGVEIRKQFEVMVETTEEMDIEKFFSLAGLKINFERPAESYLGITTETKGERLFVKVVALDGPGYKAGLNAGDELIAINELRVVVGDYAKLAKSLLIDVPYKFLVNRLGYMMDVEVVAESSPQRVKSIDVVDYKAVENCLKGSV